MRPVSRLIRWNLTSLAASQRRQEERDLPPHSADTAPGTLDNEEINMATTDNSVKV